jgi:hypothetical protein
VNWLGLDARVLVAMIVGAAAGVVLLRFGYAHGVELPWLVGLTIGAAVMLFAAKPNLMVGLIAGTLAAWTSAGAQIVFVGQARTPLELVGGFARFSETLDAARYLNFGACALAAILLGMRSLSKRPPAAVRAGSEPR